MDEEYPRLDTDLETHGSTRNLSFVSLGPKGTFFAAWEGRYSWKLPHDIEDEIREAKGSGGRGINGITLGVDKTYVIVHNDGCTWELGNHYRGLEKFLQRSTPPRVSLGLVCVWIGTY
jgi:hypothetical protein